ncbi:MAG TPA: hypothetical protein VEL07_15585 [Planctomycetota bacterium]|nr:hypothetical protein [Planctomycetota bacterium]
MHQLTNDQLEAIFGGGPIWEAVGRFLHSQFCDEHRSRRTLAGDIEQVLST